MKVMKIGASFLIAGAIIATSLQLPFHFSPPAIAVGSLCTANSDSVNVAPYNTSITTTSNVFKPTGTHEFFMSGRQYLVRQSGSILSFRMYVDATSARVTGLKLRIWHEGKVVSGSYPSFGNSTFVLVSQSENVASQITQGTAQTYTFTLNTPILAGEGDYYSILLTTNTAAANVLSSVPVDSSDRWAVEAVNTGTEVLTITGHGLSDTNQIQLYNYNSGGLIGGLAQIDTTTGGKFYYVNRIDANTFSLHTTSADSTNDANRVDLTSAGSGTTYKTAGYYKTRMYRFTGTGSSPSFWRLQQGGLNVETSQRAIPVDIRMQAPNVIMVGDSLTSGASNNTAYAYLEPGNHTAGADLSPERFAAPKYTIPGYLAQSGYTIQNMGINGVTTAQTLPLFTLNVIDMKPRVAVILLGTNDISQGTAVGDTSTNPSIIYNVDQMLSTLQSNGIKGVVVSPPGANTFNTTRSQNMDTLNTALRSLVANYGGFVYVNVRPDVNVFRSGGDAGNLWDINTAYRLSAESPNFLHFLPTGYQTISNIIANVLTNYVCQPAPALSSLSPTDNATGVSPTGNISITFDQVVQGGTGSIIIKKSSDDSTVETIAAANTGLVSGSGTTSLTINPATNLSDTTGYYVTLGANAVRNVGGRHYLGISSSSTWNFTTGDTTAPTLSTVSPADDSSDVSTTANLVLTFNEAVIGGTGTITIRKNSDNSVVETISATGALVSGSGTTTITINPSTTLENSKIYYINVSDHAFKDVSGNYYAGISSTTAWDFGTVAGSSSSNSSSSSSESPTRGGGTRGSTLVSKVRDAIARILDTFHAASNSSSSAASSEASAGSSSSRSSREGNLLTLTVDHKNVTYTDVPLNAWFTPYVASLVQDGIAEGYRDAEGALKGEFGVSDPVTFAEVIKMALESMHDDLVARPPRNLSAQGTWASPYIARAEEMKLTGLSTDLNVHSPATRGDVVHMILELLNLPIANQPSSFSDVPTNHPHSKAIETAKFYGIVKGDTAADGTALNTFRPDANLNRAEVAKIIALLKEVLK